MKGFIKQHWTGIFTTCAIFTSGFLGYEWHGLRQPTPKVLFELVSASLEEYSLEDAKSDITASSWKRALQSLLKRDISAYEQETLGLVQVLLIERARVTQKDRTTFSLMDDSDKRRWRTVMNFLVAPRFEEKMLLEEEKLLKLLNNAVIAFEKVRTRSPKDYFRTRFSKMADFAHYKFNDLSRLTVHSSFVTTLLDPVVRKVFEETRVSSQEDLGLRTKWRMKECQSASRRLDWFVRRKPERYEAKEAPGTGLRETLRVVDPGVNVRIVVQLPSVQELETLNKVLLWVQELEHNFRNVRVQVLEEKDIMPGQLREDFTICDDIVATIKTAPLVGESTQSLILLGTVTEKGDELTRHQESFEYFWKHSKPVNDYFSSVRPGFKVGRREAQGCVQRVVLTDSSCTIL